MSNKDRSIILEHEGEQEEEKENQGGLLMGIERSIDSGITPLPSNELQSRINDNNRAIGPTRRDARTKARGRATCIREDESRLVPRGCHRLL